MSRRLLRSAQAAADILRPTLAPPERLLFDLILAAGELGIRLPVNSNLREVAGVRDPRRALAPLTDRGRALRPAEGWTRARDRLARRLAAELMRRGDREYRPLRILLAYSGGALAPDCGVPADPVLRAAFGTVVRIFPRLYPSAVHRLGRLRFVDVDRLLRETRSSRRRDRKASGRRPGPLGRELAVDPRLMALLGRVLRKTVTPGMEARYIFYSKAGDCFWPHPDDPKYQANLLLCLERRLPADGGRPSCFYADRGDGSRTRIPLRPGDALVAEARGLLHGREPLRKGEKLTLLSIELKCY